MLTEVWTRLVMMVMVFHVRRQCRAYIRKAGYLYSSSQEGWTCHQCKETLDEVQVEKVVHTQSGETFKHSACVATMCARCAWVADGAMKIPIWKWLAIKEKSYHSREFFLNNERAGLKLRLAQIDFELNKRKTLVFDDRNFRKHVAMINVSKEESE